MPCACTAADPDHSHEEKQWPSSCKCLDREDLIDDPRFAKKVDRLTRSRELIALLDKEFEKVDPRGELRKRLTKGDRVRRCGHTEDIPSDQQLIDNDILIPSPPAKQGRSIARCVAWRRQGATKDAAFGGQHSDEVLKEAGFDAARSPRCAPSAPLVE